VVRGWIKLHNVQLHNLYSSPNIIRIIKSKRIKWARHVACTKEKGLRVGFRKESREERCTRKI
jgi:hypothetical protein